MFRLAKDAQGSWTKATVFSFAGVICPNDGEIPEAGLIADQSGNLYGTTRQGGNYGCQNQFAGDGVVFKLTPPAMPGDPWTETVLFSFNGKDGQEPVGRLLLGPGGALYGTTEFGGTNDLGTLFRLLPPAGGSGAWSFGLLHSFGAAGDGSFAFGNLVVVNHVLYGVTSGGGSSNNGTVYSWTP